MTSPSKAPDEFDAIRTIVQTLEPFSADEQQRLLRWAAERLGLSAAAPPEVTRDVPLAQHKPHVPDQHAKSHKDIRSFIDEKNPKSDNQFAAAVAYYYHFEAPEKARKDTINKDDLVEACRMTQRRRPSAPAQVLVNALAQGLLDKAERGQYRINSVGENLVAMVLPSQDTSTVKQSTRKKVKKKTAKGAKKKSKRTR